MLPVDFTQKNAELKIPEGVDYDGSLCGDLPIWTDGDRVVSLWRMNWKERLSALFFGRCWFLIMGKIHPPIRGLIQITAPFESQNPKQWDTKTMKAIKRKG